MVTTRTLIKTAAWGSVIVATTGIYLQQRLIERVRGFDYYKNALKSLRTHSGAVNYLGEPIKDRKFKLSDSENNFSDGKNARFAVPVSGTKDKGTYYFWAENKDGKWCITKSELELKSQPDKRLLIIKEEKYNKD